MVAVLVDTITPRIEYTFEFIFGARNVAYKLIADENSFNEISGVKLNYSKASVDCTSILPSALLYSASIFSGHVVEHKEPSANYLAFDEVPDVIASVFYVLSRMEEYATDHRDMHERFPFSKSILSEYGWIEKAVCDRWAEYLISEVLNLPLEVEKGAFVPTFDIDNTYAYKLKSGKRKLLSTLKDVSKFDSKRLKERKEVNNGGQDPYDTFDKIKSIGKQYPETKLFWLTKSNGKKDRNVPLSNEEHQLIIQDMASVTEVNIHPSYDSFCRPKMIREEVKSLESITGSTIVSSRQHFLRFKLPETYQNLIEAGIVHEYSMGFAESVGFRAGTARPHFWFDLEKNDATKLNIHPFVYMDGTLLEYNEYSIEEAKKKIVEVYNEVNRYGGDFIFLWHNETIGDYGKWNGWSEVLDFTLKLNDE